MKHFAEADKKKSRYPFVDFLRFFAVLLMVIFHFSFDLKLFGFANIDFQQSLFWWTFPRVIVFLFLLSMGLSFEMAYESGLHWKKFNRRLLKISVSAILISLFTYFVYPTRWIYFGTLHCIAICSLAAIPFLKKPKISFLVTAILLIPLAWGFRWPWIKLDHPSLDYIPALPWFGVVLLGMGLKNLGLHRLSFPQNSFIQSISKHSLVIYLLHQPLLYGLVYTFSAWY